MPLSRAGIPEAFAAPIRSTARYLTRTAALVVAASLTMSHAQAPKTFAFGGNVNERFHWLEPEILEQTKTTWVRGFFPASEFMTGKRSYETDSGIIALKRVADSGHKVILSIKWDCTQKGEAGRVPAPGSAGEAAWFGFADKLLKATAGKVSIVVVVNELFIDTQKADLDPGPDGQVPMVRFLKRLTAHIAAERLTSSDGKPLPIYAGGFTRLDQPRMRDDAATKQVLDWVNKDPSIAGVDFHLHQPDMKTSQEALEFMHRSVPHKPLIITEFSLVWKWKQSLGDKIGASEAGRSFAQQFSLPPEMTVAEFCDHDFDKPVSEAEWQAFLRSQPWFDANYLNEIGPLMSANGVAVATYALTLDPAQGDHGHIHVTTDTTPWFFNDVLIPGLAISPDPKRAPENYGFFQSYVAWQEKTAKK
jgi:hypothetical protein